MNYIEDSFGLIRNVCLAKFTLTLKVCERIILPEYKGSTFRGALGWRLKNIICVNRDAHDCTGCMLSVKCLFNQLFSPKLPENSAFLRNTSDIPSPIIIEPPLTDRHEFNTGDTLEVGLVLIGKGLEYLPYLAFAFTELGKSGIGAEIHQHGDRKYGGRFELVEIKDAIGGSTVYSIEGKVLRNTYKSFCWNDVIAQAERYTGNKLNIEFLTPVRIKEQKGDERKLTTRLDGFPQIIANIYWRLIMLAYFHCNVHNVDDDRFSELKKEATATRKMLLETSDVHVTDNHTYWQEYDRWSNRQETKMTLGGFMGSATISGNVAPYLPLIYLGQYAHIGKQTMFGLGKYTIKES